MTKALANPRLSSVNDYQSVRRVKQVKAKTPNQQAYLDSINQNMMTFGVGVAGTGKTYLAVAKAVEALQKEHVQRIILIRPIVEAGEKLGFLPGTFSEKMDPYLRPIFDAFIDIVGTVQMDRWFAEERIEVAPLAYMRGRSLHDCFIILDEGQNATFAQLKMLMTRIGYGSTMVINGDYTQTDIPNSGLEETIKLVSRLDEIGVVNLERSDVIRHPLVAKIVSLYEEG